MRQHDKTEPEHRADLIAVCRRLAALGLIGAGEGNVSIRLGPRRVLATPSGTNKALLLAHELVTTDPQGEKIAGRRAPSSELAMHLAVYRARAEVPAVVHALPPTAIALTLAGIDLASPALPEAVTALGGGIPTAPYATPSTPELAEGAARALGRHDACLMERHGALAVGRDVFEALDRMETVERVAQVVLRARLLGGNPTPLPEAEIERLLRLSGRS
ncbi:MAG: class II aldolase/adducin family protein [Deltaproteobacteria bacterium]|nr:class II aldolase/adducin family protein [Deltaproteobacteria bacterium]